MIHVIALSCDNAYLSRKVKHDMTFYVNGLGLCNLQLYQNYYLEYQTSPPCNLYHMLTAFPQCNFLLEFPEIIIICLSWTDCVWDFKNNAVWDTPRHATN